MVDAFRSFEHYAANTLNLLYKGSFFQFYIGLVNIYRAAQSVLAEEGHFYLYTRT